jgi:hypothetical protein
MAAGGDRRRSPLEGDGSPLGGAPSVDVDGTIVRARIPPATPRCFPPFPISATISSE